ncbi:unnamed protein product, partial [Hydatigera taeniaeformis]|uniref:Component of oligomeric Golgi complex 6 n=1 Tax=Hydatigena taeniaeformis TaxID=6205 RepID=A0A0R3WVG9_HYDTA
MLPLVDGSIQMCIRSLPCSSLYVDKCFKNITLTEKLIGALETVNMADNDHLLPLSSALEAIATVAKEITFTTVNRIRFKLVEAANVLPTQLSDSSLQNVFQIGRTYTNIGAHLLEGMRYQYENPTPSLKRVHLPDLDYDTDIDVDPVDSIDTLIMEHVQKAQRMS